MFVMKKLLAYLKGLFSNKLENVAVPAEMTKAGEDVKNEVVEAAVVNVQEQITDAVTQATEKIEERLAEVAKEEKPVTAKDIKAKAKRPAKPKAEVEVSKEEPKKPARKRPARKPAAKKPE